MNNTNTPSASEEVKRIIALAVASGVTTYRHLAKVAGKSNTLAQRWGNPDEDGDAPIALLALDPEFAAFVEPLVAALRARLAAGAPRAMGPEAGLMTVFARIADWIGAVSEALVDKHVDPAEAHSLLKRAHALRAVLDRVTEQLAERASEVQ